MSLLSFEGLSLEIGQCRICESFDLDFEAGQIWGILGPNGSGKSTLLHAILGIHEARSGTIRIDGRPLSAWRPRELARIRALLPQINQERFPARVIEVCLSGLHPRRERWQWDSPEDHALALATLDAVGLSGFEQRWLEGLSGGEMQRLMSAVVIMQAPRIWLLDEPTNHLDIKHQIMILDLLVERIRAARGLGLMVLHDPNMAARYCSHIITLDGDNRVGAGPQEHILSRERLSALYGIELCEIELGSTRLHFPDLKSS